MEELPRLKRPLLEERDDEVDPSQAEAVPDLPDGRTLQTMALLATRRGSGFGRFALGVFGTLTGFVASVWAWNFVTGLFATNTWLGGVALVLLGTALAVALVIAAGEVQAFARLRRLDAIRSEAQRAAGTDDVKAARLVLNDVMRLYASRPELSWGLARLAERQAEVMDADALLVLAESELIAPLDAMALREVEEAARRVATVTALVPLALADLATALVSNLRMIRRVAEIYG
ncbi:MAG: TIGR01620 family protein, partial [Alphaproteobacteria bacterium]